MKIKYKFIPLFFAFLLLFMNSCQRKGPKEINSEFSQYISAFTFGSVSSSSAIQIELNQDMPTVELNKEIDKNLFEFSPRLKGKAYWTSSRSIKFIPDEGELKQGQAYDAWFKLGDILQVDKKFQEFYFYFKVVKQNFTVSVLPYSPMKDNDKTWNQVKGLLVLSDDAPMDQIQKMFSVSGEPNTAKIKVEPAGTKNNYLVVVDSLRRENKKLQYSLNVDGTAIGIDKQEKLIIEMPPLESFEVLDVGLDTDPSRCVRITFSDPLSNNQNIQGLISVNGIENYSYDIDKNVLKIYFDQTEDVTSLNLLLRKELKNTDNRSLTKNYNYELSLESNLPEIKLLNAGNILPDSKNLNIPFQAVNLWAVDVSVVKIYQNNILGYLQSNNLGENNELRRFGKLILKKRIRLDEDRSMELDRWNNFSIDLSSMIKKDPGAIYQVKFNMKKEYSLYPCDGKVPQIPEDASLEHFDNGISEDDEAFWDRPDTYFYEPRDWTDYDWEERNDPCKPSYYADRTYSCMAMSSNIGIIAKIGTSKKVSVVLTDILTTNPLSGSEVDLYNFQMQKIGSAKTDGNGFADVEYKGGLPFAVVATQGKDKGYLKLVSNQSLSLSNFDISGKELPKGMKGYIYGERGVWRPGDSIFLTFILEDKEKNLPQGHPVSLEFFTPSGQMYQRQVQTAGQNGFYAFKMSTQPSSPTGDWRAVIKVGGVAFSKSIHVETIKPNRLKIRLKVGDLVDASSGSFNGTISSQWLHGAPAANLKAQVEMNLSAVGTPFKGYEEYSFNDPSNNFVSDNYTLFDGTLDSEGNATVSANLPPASNAPGMLRANFISRVFENGGDASIYTQTAGYSPYPAYVGVKSPTKNYYEALETDKDNVLDIVTLTPTGKPISRKDVNVKVYKIKWSWWWNRNGDDLSSYINNTAADIVLDQNISTVNGKGSVKFRVDYPEWGRYLIMAKDKEGGHVAGRIVYVDWPAYRGRSDKGDAAGLTMLSFSTDKHSYKVGDKATVIIPKSSNGRALISLENGSKIIQKNWLKTSASEDTKYTFEVTSDMAPNFYVFATLLQPHAQQNNDLPIRLYGVLNVNVDNSNTILTPVINMPNELRPEKEFTVSVSEKNRKPMTYTLAIVDDGLLDLTSFKTPNAWNDFYARQSLGVRTWDMFDLVVGAQTGKLGPLLSIGGDETLKPSSNPVNRFKPIVKYLGPFTLQKGQTQSHKIQLPAYVGSVRTMVVAGSSEGLYGSAEKTVQVKNPLMILSTLPRVAGPNEEFLLPVNVFAMDKKVKDVRVTVKTSNGLFKLEDGAVKNVQFAEVGDKTIYFKLKVAPNTGVEKVTIIATGGGETSTETIDIEVRNPNPSVLLTSEALIAPNENETMDITMDAPRSDDWVRLEVSRMPGVNLNKNLDFLHDYPYGCSEQVTSKAFPLLYVSAFKTFTAKELDFMKKNVNDAIKTLSSRQLSGGGIVYWEGNSYANEWVTTYAGHFLLEAKAKGYNVPESVLSKWKRFQKNAAQRWNNNSLYSSYYSYSMDDLQQAYRLYTLALANEPELGAMNRLKEMQKVSVQARWRLAAAYVLAGKKNAAQQIVNSIPFVVEAYSANNNTYGSPARDAAMIMETNLLLGNVTNAFKLATTVSEALNSPYISTQSASFGLIAMSELSEKMGQGVIDFDWSLNGVSQKVQKSGAVFQEYNIKPQQKVSIDFMNKGKARLYVRLVGKTHPMVDTYEASHNGLNLYVKYVDQNGAELDVTTLKQGQEFYAVVVVQNISGNSLTDLALNQIFPSGWEIFNNRLFNAVDSENSGFNYQDIRDDRVMTFFNLSSGYSTSVKVRLQAAYRGRFYLPAVSCEAMYSPTINARTTGMWVDVTQ